MEGNIEASFRFFSGNLKPDAFLKHDKTSLGGQPDNPCGSAFAAGAVPTFDEFGKGQRCLSFMGFHNRKIRPLNASLLLGISPMRFCM